MARWANVSLSQNILGGAQRYPNMSHLTKFHTVIMSNMGNCCNGVFFNSSKMVKLFSEFNCIESFFLLKYSYEVRWHLFDISPIVVLWPNFQSSSSTQSRSIFHAMFADPRCVYQMTRGLQERSPSADCGVGESRRIWLLVVPRRRLSELAGRQSIDL